MEKIGPVFGESIRTEKLSKRRNYEGGLGDSSSRFYLIPLILAVAIVVAIFRLFSLQFISGSYYRNLSDSNRIRTVVIHAPRGTIFDRNGVPMVFNTPGFRESINGKTKLLSQDEAISLLAQGNKKLEIDNLREYPYKDSMAHVLGYIGQISHGQLENPEFSGYSSGDLIGQMGVEQQYESLLKGVDGKELDETDNLGRVVRKLGATDPVSGHDITLTIDANLQKAAYLATRGVQKGAVIATTPKGEVLALISKPSFDPNLFTQGGSYKIATSSGYRSIADVLSDSTNQPFLDRAISGVYPPGSTFKIVVATAGLSDNVIDTSWSIEDTGIIKVGDFSFANWYYTDYGGKDGQVNVIKGLQRSNDIFFYRLAEKIGVDKLSSTSEKFGLGKTLGIDLAGEEAGLVPTQEWKQKNVGEPWYLGDTYHYGIGQGYLLTTPLQVNTWTQAVANGGTIYQPHVLKSLGDNKLASNLFGPNTTDPVRQGMIEACSTGGVAWPLFNFEVKNPKLKIDNKNILPVASASADMRHVVVACKTGTAQHGTDTTLPHAWITLFAPAYDPQIVLTVLSEDSGEGSNIAGPIAKEILTSYFSK